MTAASAAAGRPTIVRTFPTMGTVVSVHGRPPARPASAPAIDAFEAAVSSVRAEFDALDRLLSPYRADSDTCRIDRGALAVDEADERTRHVVAACARAGVWTRGRFDAWIGGRFDPSGYVKGHAAQTAFDRFLRPLVERAGWAGAGLDAGGDLVVASAPGVADGWRIGVERPGADGSLLAVLELDDGAVATSGPARRGAHILDPVTGRPAHGIASATVVADRLDAADVLATAIVAAGAAGVDALPLDDVRAVLVRTGAGAVRRWVAGVEVRVVDPALSDGPGSVS